MYSTSIKNYICGYMYVIFVSIAILNLQNN